VNRDGMAAPTINQREETTSSSDHNAQRTPSGGNAAFLGCFRAIHAPSCPMGQDESLKVLPAPQIVRSHGEQKCRPRLQFPMLFTPLFVQRFYCVLHSMGARFAARQHKKLKPPGIA